MRRLAGVGAVLIGLAGATAAQAQFEVESPERTFSLTTKLTFPLYNFGVEVRGVGGFESLQISGGYGFHVGVRRPIGALLGSPFAGPPLSFAAGVDYTRATVTGFRPAGGPVVPTAGLYEFLGASVGLRFGDDLEAADPLLPVSSTLPASVTDAAPPVGPPPNPVTFAGFALVGYGSASANGFGGAFQVSGSGVYGVLGFDVGYQLSPGGPVLSLGIQHRAFDFGAIKGGETFGTAGLSLTW
jgi:hypothetical protein